MKPRASAILVVRDKAKREKANATTATEVPSSALTLSGIRELKVKPAGENVIRTCEAKRTTAKLNRNQIERPVKPSASETRPKLIEPKINERPGRTKRKSTIQRKPKAAKVRNPTRPPGREAGRRNGTAIKVKPRPPRQREGTSVTRLKTEPSRPEAPVSVRITTATREGRKSVSLNRIAIKPSRGNETKLAVP